MPTPSGSTTLLGVRDYDLTATLSSGQAFRWRPRDEAWEGIIGTRWVRLVAVPEGLRAETMQAESDWSWLEHYLQTRVDFEAVLKTFPTDDAMQASVRCCRGLRLLRQDPWECLASFILSSTKQIVQIQQIIGLLCSRYGAPVPTPGRETAHAFPTAATLAALSESELRDCKMGFRAPYFRATALRVAEGSLKLESLRGLSLEEAREQLTDLPGVGDKIANCVLLFAYGFPQAFPVDVWIMKALRQLYFPRRRPSGPRLLRFIGTHFGPHAGYAQQYLFHYMRTAR